MEAQRNQIVSRKKTFWKLVKTIFPPAQTIANLMSGCGSGKRGKGKRRLSIRNMHVAKEAFLRASFHQRQPNTNRRSVVTNFVQTSSQIPEPPTENSTIDSISNGFTDNTISIMPNESLPRPTADLLDAITNISSVDQLEPSATTIAHAPMNLEQAQLLLESLTLCGSSHAPPETHTNHDSDHSVETGRGEQLVEVEVEVEISGEDIPSPSSFSDSNSFQYEPDQTANDSNTTNMSSITDSQEVVLRRAPKLSTSSDAGSEFHGWRRSSIEVTSNPPVTLAYIPSGLCVGDRIVWVKDDIPEIGTVRWIGKIRNQFYSGIEFDKPIGNSSGLYGYGTGLYKQLFSCKLSYGRFVPVKELVLYKDYHDTGIKSGIVCVICRDDFLDTWEPDLFVPSTPDNLDDQHGLQPFHMVSTKCGHLYHWGCLDEWFSTKKRIEYHCPFCVRPMERDEVIRIFPTQI